MSVPGSLSLPDVRRSRRHALVRGLRLARHEAQLTQVIAAVAFTDRRFASCVVRLILQAAERHGRNAAAVRALGDVPDELDCAAEHTLYDRKGLTLGRVDLRFDADDFTLFVENKLHSHFGEDQLLRYETALALLPAGRAGLVAITRNVPSHNELNVHGPGWLGAVRWAQIVDGLRQLPIADAGIAEQWPLLVDVLEAEGDLGVTSIDTDLVRAWARYLDGRQVLADLLDSVRERGSDIIAGQLLSRYPDHGSASEVCVPITHGKKGAVSVKREQQLIWSGYAIPATDDSGAIALQFWPDDGEPCFGVAVIPGDVDDRLRDNDAQLAAASLALLKNGFQQNRGLWWSVHPPAEYLHHDDVPKRLLELVEPDVRTIIESDILLRDMTDRPRRRPTRKR